VLTSDNPRSEDPAEILEQMLAGIHAAGSRGEVIVEIDRRAAIERAVAAAAAGDVLVVAGKGHEPGQEYADRTLEFDDRDVVRAALRASVERAGTP
jgi:UDP-N-acetylmuramoyl-L-alanyl-D-glutamate--2,6-diaminopimelate ligase